MSHGAAYCGSIDRLYQAGDWSSIAAIVTRHFGVECSGEDLKTKSNPPARWWSDGSWLVWFKIRLMNLGRFAVRHSESDEIRFTCELHVGFTQIEESQAMIARLRNEKIVFDPQVARSKISTTTALDIEPIDRVAHRVV